MKYIAGWAIAVVCLLPQLVVGAEEDGFVSIFDGKTLAGWEGDKETFRVADGAIVAGNLDKKIPRNEFLCTEKTYEDFELRLQAKLIGQGKNAGVQFRSRRIPNHHEVIGYQCDIGVMRETNIWGALYDESRRRKFLATGDQAPLKKAFRPGKWNDLRIRCEGPRIQIWVNDANTVEYTEADDKIARKGIIGLQIHGGPAAEASYRKIRIRELKPAKVGQRFAPKPQVRRPIAMAALDSKLWIANQRSGSVSVVDAASLLATAEHTIGQRLSDLAVLDATSKSLIAVDESLHQAFVLDAKDARIQQRVPVAKHPVAVSVQPQGKHVAISSLWSRRLTLLTWAGNALISPKVLDLEFAPRKLAWIDGGKRLLIASSFDGRMAVWDTGTKQLRMLPEISAHNIRGLRMAGNGRDVLISHQILNSYRSTTMGHVFWGNVMQNVVREWPIKTLLAKNEEYERPGEMYLAYPIGRPGDATGDPSDVLATESGATVVSLSGVNEIAVRRIDAHPFERIAVGGRPTALAEAGGKVFIANTSDDTLSVLDPKTLKITATISLGPAHKRTQVERGEELFYNATLSLDGWYSCHSCHTDGHTNGMLNDNFGDGTTGAPKRILSLHGTGETGPWAWSAQSKSIEAQVRKSLLNTMQAEDAKPEHITAITAFVKTLKPVPGIDVARNTVDRAAVDRGRKVFQARNCADCHASPTFTSANVYDVGVDDGRGVKEYNPPSLRGVSQRHAFFHDNRAASLRDVFVKHKHNDANTLPNRQLDDLLAFLRSI